MKSLVSSTTELDFPSDCSDGLNNPIRRFSRVGFSLVSFFGFDFGFLFGVDFDSGFGSFLINFE